MSMKAQLAKGLRLLCNGAVASENTALTAPAETTAPVTATDQEDDIVVSMPGEASVGDVTLSVNFINDTQQQAFKTMKRDKTTGLFQIVWPSTFKPTPFFTQEFTGWIKSITPATPMNGLATWAVVITPVDLPTEPSGAFTALTTPFISVADEDGHAIALTPTAAADKYTYTGTAFTTSVSVLVTPTSTAAGTIYVNGTVVASGAASGAITLDANRGDITTIFVVLEKANCKTCVIRIRIKMGIAAYVA